MGIDLPPGAGPEREKVILAHVAAGDYEAEWVPVVSERNGRRAEFYMFADALRIEGVRVGVSAETQQKIADMTGCSLLTPKLADLAWAQRKVTLEPRPREFSSATQPMLDHSAEVDAALAALGSPEGLKQTVGKHWVISEKLKGTGMAMNYGWHFAGQSFQGIRGETCASLMKDESGQYVRLIQGCGTRHDMFHSDYSQNCVLVARACRVDGQDMDIRALLADRDLSWLASHEGPLTVLRQPGVPEPAEHVVILPRVTVTA